MAKIRITLRRNPDTGKQDLLVELQSDEDLMQFEHERLHAQVIDDLVRRGVDIGSLGPIVVEREEHALIVETSSPTSSPTANVSDDAAELLNATVGDGATGDGATGDGATGDGATGDGATGDGADIELGPDEGLEAS